MNRLNHTNLCGTVVALLLLLLSLSGAARAMAGPERMLDDTTRHLIETIRAERGMIEERPSYMFELIERLLVPNFDVTRMSRLVLGKNWRKANEEQRALFQREFKTLLVRFYSSALLNDTNQLDRLLDQQKPLVVYQPGVLSRNGKQSIVRSDVYVPDGPRVPVVFRLYRSAGEQPWRVIDLTVEGISMLTNYRGTFSTEIRQKGIDGMLQTLAQRNRSLAERSKGWDDNDGANGEPPSTVTEGQN